MADINTTVCLTSYNSGGLGLDSGDRKNSNTLKLMFDQFRADLFKIIAYILVFSWYFTESTCLMTMNKFLSIF